MLYLVQHGEATKETEDPARPLTEHGRQEVVKVARALARVRLGVSVIAHSGKLRARQTAELQAWLSDKLGGAQWFNGASFGWADLSVAPYLNRSFHYGFGTPAASSRSTHSRVLRRIKTFSSSRVS